MWKSTLIGEALKAFKYCIYNILCSGNVWRSFLKPFCVLWSLETWFETHMCFFKKFLNICPLAVCFLLSTFSPIQVNLSNFDMVMESDLGTFSPVALQFTGSVAAQKVRSLHGNHRSIFIYSEHCNSVYPGKHWVLKKKPRQYEKHEPLFISVCKLYFSGSVKSWGDHVRVCTNRWWRRWSNC